MLLSDDVVIYDTLPSQITGNIPILRSKVLCGNVQKTSFFSVNQRLLVRYHMSIAPKTVDSGQNIEVLMLVE